MWSLGSPSSLVPFDIPSELLNLNINLFSFHRCQFRPIVTTTNQCRLKLACTSTSSSSSAPSSAPPVVTFPGPVVRKRKRYRKSYPGEAQGITEEMRFVAMRLRTNPKLPNKEGKEDEKEIEGESEDSWHPSMEGFLKYLVDSKIVFDTLERIVDQSDDVSYAYFRKTGLERSKGLSKDLEKLTQLGLSIPEPTSAGTSYSKYLEEIGRNSVSSFLSHYYNIYFAHITGGQEIGKKVCNMLLDGRELEFYKWEGDSLELIKDVRENLNKVAEHWSREEKNRCLRETTKCFRLSSQIIRLIIS